MAAIMCLLLPNTPPNPHLAHLPERDITTPSGRVLTLMDPHDAINGMPQRPRSPFAVHEHLASLKASLTENAADPWETNALHALGAGATEVSSVEFRERHPVLRLMRPMVGEASCRQCHVTRNQPAGTLWGGISVAVPLEPYYAAARSHLPPLLFGHGALWVLGLVGLLGGGRHLHQRIQQQERTAASLRASEKRARQLFERAPVAYQSLDAEGRLREVNAAWLDMLGCTRAEVLGRWFGDLLVPEQVELFRERFAQFKMAGAVHGVEFDLQRQDGTVVKIVADGRIGYDDQGRFQCTHCVLHNVTDARRNEQRFRELAESLPQTIFEMDLTGRLTFVNQQGFETFRCTPADLAHGLSAFDMLNPEEHERTRNNIARVAAGEVFPAEEYSGRRQDGTGLPVLIHVRAIHQDGAVVGIRGIVVDITERKQAEDELRRANSLLASTLESTADGILVVDMDGQVVRYNRRFLELWQLPDDALRPESGTTPIEQILKQLKDPFAFLTKMQELQAQPEAESSSVLEFKDGRVLERYSRPQWLDERVVGRVWSFRDITERFQAEQARRQSEELLRAIFEATPDCIFIKNIEGRYTHLNPPVEQLFNRPAASLVGANDAELWPADVAEHLRAVDAEIWQGRVVRDEHTVLVNGQACTFQTVKVPLRDAQGEITGLCGIARDITALKAVQTSLQNREAELRATLDHAPLIICLLDDQARIVRVNQAAARFAGRSEAELCGNSHRRFVRLRSCAR